MVHDYNITENS